MKLVKGNVLWLALASVILKHWRLVHIKIFSCLEREGTHKETFSVTRNKFERLKYRRLTIF